MRTPLRRYYRGHNLVGMRDVQAGATRYYHFDHQGTTQCLTDGTGAVTDRFASDAWGVEVKRTGSSINRQWYVGNFGYYRDAALGSHYIRARWLRFISALFLSADAMPYRLSELPYGYVTNGPSLSVDPSGNQRCPKPCDRSSDGKRQKPTEPYAGGFDCGSIKSQYKQIQAICLADAFDLPYPRMQAITKCCFYDGVDCYGKYWDYWTGCVTLTEGRPDPRENFSSLPDAWKLCIWSHELRRKCICNTTKGMSEGGYLKSARETDRILECVGNVLVSCGYAKGLCKPIRSVQPFDCLRDTSF